MISGFDQDNAAGRQVWVEDCVAADTGTMTSGITSLHLGAAIGTKTGLPVPLEQGPGLVDPPGALKRVHSEHGNTDISEAPVLRREK